MINNNNSHSQKSTDLSLYISLILGVVEVVFLIACIGYIVDLKDNADLLDNSYVQMLHGMKSIRINLAIGILAILLPWVAGFINGVIILTNNKTRPESAQGSAFGAGLIQCIIGANPISAILAITGLSSYGSQNRQKTSAQPKIDHGQPQIAAQNNVPPQYQSTGRMFANNNIGAGTDYNYQRPQPQTTNIARPYTQPQDPELDIYTPPTTKAINLEPEVNQNAYNVKPRAASYNQPPQTSQLINDETDVTYREKIRKINQLLEEGTISIERYEELRRKIDEWATAKKL